MAHRQALRQLQSRLAERLQAARTDAAQAASWLAVQAGAGNYLLPLAQVGEIFHWPGVLRVPYSQPWFWGVANLRGNLMGVVDLCTFLGQPAERSEQSLMETSLLSVAPALQVNVALVVDRLMGLRGVEDMSPQQLSPATTTTSTGVPGLGSWFTDQAAVPWRELNLQNLVHSQTFLQVRI